MVYRFLSSMALPAGIKNVTDDIIKSEEDKRLYRGLELNNGMKILLISDPTTDKSSASMDVNIGNLVLLISLLFSSTFNIYSVH